MQILKRTKHYFCIATHITERMKTTQIGFCCCCDIHRNLFEKNYFLIFLHDYPPYWTIYTHSIRRSPFFNKPCPTVWDIWSSDIMAKMANYGQNCNFFHSNFLLNDPALLMLPGQVNIWPVSEPQLVLTLYRTIKLVSFVFLECPQAQTTIFEPIESNPIGPRWLVEF